VQSKLTLGGHSFIEQLGNDPGASFEEQCALVAACLDSGIRWLDTTYYQERVALGKVLQTLGRRADAAIQAWNFFKQPGKEDDLVPWTPFVPSHIDTILAELQTDYVDLLVIHAEDDPAILQEELELAQRWIDAGKVRAVGLGMGAPRHLDYLSSGHPVTEILTPYNAFNQGAAALFDAAKARGLQAVAMSPFIRGWKLDEIGGDTATVADVLLRWVITQLRVDRAIVAMRKRDWVDVNLQSEARGPLTTDEQAQLQTWLEKSTQL
jgi:aryl-alcohol dehydrogenase-like predicted oxidoreductase